jgi:hypothetical protein
VATLRVVSQDEMMGLKKTGDQKDALLIARNKKVDEYEQVCAGICVGQSVRLWLCGLVKQSKPFCG